MYLLKRCKLRERLILLYQQISCSKIDENEAERAYNVFKMIPASRGFRRRFKTNLSSFDGQVWSVLTLFVYILNNSCSFDEL